VTGVAVFWTSPDARQPARAVVTTNRAADTRIKRIMNLSFAPQGGINLNRQHHAADAHGGEARAP
jgi:hypothetical protein